MGWGRAGGVEETSPSTHADIFYGEGEETSPRYIRRESRREENVEFFSR